MYLYIGYMISVHYNLVDKTIFIVENIVRQWSRFDCCGRDDARRNNVRLLTLAELLAARIYR